MLIDGFQKHFLKKYSEGLSQGVSVLQLAWMIRCLFLLLVFVVVVFCVSFVYVFYFFFCILFLLLFFVFLLPVFVLFCCTRSCLHSVSSAIVYDVQHLLSTLPPLTWQLQQHRQRLKTKESNASPQLTRRARPPSCITTSV